MELHFDPELEDDVASNHSSDIIFESPRWIEKKLLCNMNVNETKFRRSVSWMHEGESLLHKQEKKRLENEVFDLKRRLIKAESWQNTEYVIMKNKVKTL